MAQDPGIPPIARPEPTIGNVKLDEEGRLIEDVQCRRCSYNLRSLSINGRCPECGTAVGRSAQGDLLRFCEPVWVGQLASGMNWIVASIVVGFVVGGCGAISIGALGLPQPIFFMVMVALGIVPLVGYWKVTTPDPAGVEGPNLNARKLVRATQVTVFGAHVLELLLQTAGMAPPASMVNVTGQVIGTVGVFAIFIYACRLAARIPNDKLARQCRVVMWGLATVSVMAIAVTATVAVATTAPILVAPTSGPAAVGTAPLVTTGPAGLGVGIGGPPTLRGTPFARSVPSLLGILIIACTGLMALGGLVFGIWGLVLLVRFRKALKEAAQLAMATWAGATWQQVEPDVPD